MKGGIVRVIKGDASSLEGYVDPSKYFIHSLTSLLVLGSLL